MTELLFATAATETASYQAGRYGGAIVMGILVILGILNCIKTIADERGNTKCALSLGLTLVSIGATAVFGAMMRGGSLNGPFERYLMWFCFLMLGAALVLAIWGIIEFSYSDAYDHGRGLAITTLVIFGFIGVIAVPNFLRARAVAQARAKSGTDSASSSNAAPASVAYREYGFSFQPPSKPWAEYNAKKINPEATIGFMRARPAIFFMIIAENEHTEGVTLDAVLEVVKARMNSQATSVQLLKETSVSRAGIRGMQLETQARLDGASVYFIQWVGLHKSYLYQLCCWGDQRDREKVQGEAEQMFNRFQVLDGAPWAGMQEVKPQYAGAKPPRGDKYQRSDRFYYAADISQSDWKQWGTEGRLRRDADFGATHPSGAHFSLIPVSLMNQRPPQEALRRAFAVVAGLKQLQMKERQNVMQKHFHGVEYRIP